MPNIKIDDLKFNTEDFDEIENKLLADIQLCDAQISIVAEEIRMFEIVKANLSAQIGEVIKNKNPKK